MPKNKQKMFHILCQLVAGQIGILIQQGELVYSDVLFCFLRALLYHIMLSWLFHIIKENFDSEAKSRLHFEKDTLALKCRMLCQVSCREGVKKATS